MDSETQTMNLVSACHPVSAHLTQRSRVAPDYDEQGLDSPIIMVHATDTLFETTSRLLARYNCARLPFMGKLVCVHALKV